MKSRLQVFFRLMLVCGMGVMFGCKTEQPRGYGGGVSDLSAFVPEGKLSVEKVFREYTVRIYEAEFAGSFEIINGGKRVYAHTGFRFYIGGFDEQSGNFIRMGQDVTGDGNPDLVVVEWTGGAHCCFLTYLFEIGDKFRFVQEINARHSDGACFENMDQDAALEFVMNDWTFAYWRTCFADSPAPNVVLKYNGTKYMVAPALMRKPCPTAAGLAEEVQAAFSKRTEAQGPPPLLWAKMLDLIYSGTWNRRGSYAKQPGPMNGEEEQNF